MKDRRDFEKKDNELLDFARSYLSESFPNPERQGCPPDGALRSLAFDPRKTQPSLTEHLAGCSPCFARYSELLTQFKSQTESEHKWSWKRLSAWPKAHPLLAGTIVTCAVVIAIVAGILLNRLRQPNSPPVQVRKAPSHVSPPQQVAAYSPFSIDLSKISPVRGSQEPPSTSRRIRVPSSPLHLTLILPLGSEEQSYRVTLQAGTKQIWSKSMPAHLTNGQVLIRFDEDLSNLESGRYDLEVASPTGIRLVQPVSIESVSRRETGPSK